MSSTLRAQRNVGATQQQRRGNRSLRKAVARPPWRHTGPGCAHGWGPPSSCSICLGIVPSVSLKLIVAPLPPEVPRPEKTPRRRGRGRPAQSKKALAKTSAEISALRAAAARARWARKTEAS